MNSAISKQKGNPLFDGLELLRSSVTIELNLCVLEMNINNDLNFPSCIGEMASVCCELTESKKKRDNQTTIEELVLQQHSIHDLIEIRYICNAMVKTQTIQIKFVRTTFVARFFCNKKNYEKSYIDDANIHFNFGEDINYR